MTQQGIWVLGGYQSDFARNLSREEVGFDGLTAEVVGETLADSGVAATDIETVHVANAFGQLFTGQGHLGAMPATVEPGLWGVPASRHEAACASGSVAVLAAMAELEAGRYETALVVGIELERNVDGHRAAQHLGSIDDVVGVEVHDCFAASGYLAIDHLGITAPGDAWKAIESGEVARGGRMPVNPSGLIGGGHPVGATGLGSSPCVR